MFDVVDDHVFPFLRTLGGDGSTYAHHMKDARFTIPTPALLAKVVDLLDQRADGGPRHQGRPLRVHARQDRHRRAERPVPHAAPHHPADGGADGADAEGRHLRPRLRHLRLPGRRGRVSARRTTRRSSATPKLRKHFHERLFHGFDFDNTMLRIGSMNMLLHGVENPDIRYQRLPRAGPRRRGGALHAGARQSAVRRRRSTTRTRAKDLQQIVKTKKTELLFLALFLRLLKPGGRAAVIVPDGVLFGSTKAHKELRRMLVEEQKLDAVISLPAAFSGPMPASRPRSCCSPRPTPAARIMSGSTTCRPTAGRSTTSAPRCSPEDKLGAGAGDGADGGRSTQRTTCPTSWPAGRSATGRSGSARARRRASACQGGYAAQGYDLSLNRYKEVVHEEVTHVPPEEILADLAELEKEIQQGMKDLREMLR